MATKHTAPDLSREWHPTWCDRDAGGCGRDVIPEDRHHDGPLVDFRRQGEGDFTFTCRRYAIGAPGTDYPVNRGLEIEVESEVYADQRMKFHGNTDEIRDLADFLFTEADRLDAWAEEQGVCDD